MIDPYNLESPQTKLMLVVFVSHNVIKSMKTLIQQTLERNEAEHARLLL